VKKRKTNRWAYHRTAGLRLSEVALVLVRFDHVACIIVKRGSAHYVTGCNAARPLVYCLSYTALFLGLLPSAPASSVVTIRDLPSADTTTRPVRDTISVQTGLTATGFGLSGSPQPAVANAIAKTENARSSDFIYGSPQ
jgi:hypothetical protein